jgi:hypothetical protein
VSRTSFRNMSSPNSDEGRDAIITSTPSCTFIASWENEQGGTFTFTFHFSLYRVDTTLRARGPIVDNHFYVGPKGF